VFTFFIHDAFYTFLTFLKFLRRFKFENHWDFTAGGAIRIAHYDVIDDVKTRKL